jgi:hypothetical protein
VLGKIGRLFRKIQGLRHVGAQVGEAQSQVRSLQAVVEGLAGGTRSLQEQLDDLRAEVHQRRRQCELDRARVQSLLAAVEGLACGSRSLQEQLAGLHAAVREQRLHCDLAKSKSEVPRALVEEFQHWKACQSPLSEPLVSVCVATYNRAKLLTERCIASVLGQTYGRLELIVVGDGCTDHTEASVARINDPRLTFVNLPSRPDYPTDRTRKWMVAGTQAGNKAISLARGDFITHLDDDDEYLPVRLEKLVDFAILHRLDFVWHPFWYEQVQGNWMLNEANDLALGQVTTSSVFYRGWFKRLGWDMDAHLLGEPGDWNLFRRIKFLGPAMGRYPDALLRHYVERNGSEQLSDSPGDR